MEDIKADNGGGQDTPKAANKWEKGVTPSGARPFQKGVVNNPTGRPKGSHSTETLIKRVLARTVKLNDPLALEIEDEKKRPLVELSFQELLIIRQVQKGLLGDTPAVEWLHARGFGKMVQQQVVSVNASHNLRYEVENAADFKAALLAIEEEERQLEAEAEVGYHKAEDAEFEEVVV